MNLIPISVKNALWSYDLDKIDIQKDKNLIIFNVLNWGTSDAVLWLYKNYSKQEISEIISNSNAQNWSKKSLNYWSIIFNAYPKNIKRFS